MSLFYGSLCISQIADAANAPVS